ncbi:MAG: hypothetical protein ACI4TA_01560 [Acetatifactor sp.]
MLGGLAIRDINSEHTTTLGYFSPAEHDGGGYAIQTSYSFIDADDRIVCPTSNNHVLMLKATDSDGNVLSVFEKVLDIDIKALAEAALGKTLDQNLLSIVFDYEGNLWFVTGGFRIYPDRMQQGVMGYITRDAIDAILDDEEYAKRWTGQCYWLAQYGYSRKCASEYNGCHPHEQLERKCRRAETVRLQRFILGFARIVFT